MLLSRLGRLLTRLGIERLWGGGPETAYPRVLRWTVVPYTALWLSPSYGYGLDRLPASGGAVLAANHLSAIDPPLIGSFTRRAIWYMMKSELHEMPFIGEALTWAGAFPIRRGESDREGLRRARELVRDGHVVGMFAEGTRQRLGYPGPMHPGAVMLAMTENVPIVPVGVESFGWSRKNRRPSCVVFGEPMAFDGLPRNGRGYKEATELLRVEIVRLWRQAAEAIVAGFPEQLPDGTPRGKSFSFTVGQGSVTKGKISNVSSLR
jgi:1-acyl-sn-glycerol-3-phosphate acyltransferase